MKISVCFTSVILILVGYVRGVHGRMYPEFQDIAQTPPMGWNSYAACGSSVNASQFRAEADFMEANRHGEVDRVVQFE